MSYDLNLLEEELKNKVAETYFKDFDRTRIIGKVDFCVTVKDSPKPESERENFLWAESKMGISDIYKSLVQLILTIGKARTFDKYMPPTMLGAFDAEKFAFLPYNAVHDIFYLNDFNWNVAPSNHETKEFQLVYEKVKTILDQNTLLYFYDKHDRELREFIHANFTVGRFGLTKTRIDKNNFIAVYTKWLQTVKPTIAVNWELAKKAGIIDGDFYLADLLAGENETLKDKLYVLLRKDHYELDRKIDDLGFFNARSTTFTDKQKAHTQFWNKYERPPLEQYWDYIVERRDLLVPQDIRERKGSFFTPQIWVELAQKYLADVLGENWQEDYYIWDCAAGTGNLLTGLTNEYHVWASTLDKQDVDVMHERIESMKSNSPGGKVNLLKDHVFQFDFLNDDFSKLPKPLLNIINDPKKRQKLVIFINPPYAESGTGVGRTFKRNVSTETRTYTTYKDKVGKGINELYLQFLARIYFEIPDCIIGEFSTLKVLKAPNFKKFRNLFLAKLEKSFIVPANSFDNVKGRFPIGFKVWNCKKKEKFESRTAEVYHKEGGFFKQKTFYSYDNEKGLINDWLRQFFDKKSTPIGILHNNKNDFQHNVQVRITVEDIKDHTTPITVKNIREMCIYLAVRHAIKSTWLNDRDQFLFPNDGWKTDKLFQNDCLTFSLFHSQNKISSNAGTNHWIPFSERDVRAREKFESDFMSKFIAGKLKPEDDASTIFNIVSEPVPHYGMPHPFSEEAKAVFDAGRELWTYFHAQPDCNVNASLYDIRAYFQGRNESGKMNNISIDEIYTKLIENLRDTIEILSQNIEPKVYKYGFLKA